MNITNGHGPHDNGDDRDSANSRGQVPSWSGTPLPAVPPSRAGAHRAPQTPARNDDAQDVDIHAADPRTGSMETPATLTPRVSLLRQVTAAPVPSADAGQPGPDTAAISGPGSTTSKRDAEGSRRLDGGLTGTPGPAASDRTGTPGPAASGPSAPAAQGPTAPLPSPETRAVPAAPGPDGYELHVSGNMTELPQTAHPGARNMLRRMLQSDSPPTISYNIVDRLIGSPYANSRQTEKEAQENEARPILVLALDLAESMLRWGAGAIDVETSVIAVTTSLGLRHVDVDITNQSVHLNWTRADAFPVSVLRVVRKISDNYAGLALVHQLVGDVSAGRAEYDEARKRLRTIRRRPLPYKNAIEVAAGSLFAGMFVLLVGGKPTSALACAITTTLATLIIKWGKKTKVPNFFCVAGATFLVTLIALSLYSIEWITQPGMVVAGGIMLMLPSGRFVSAVQDAINGFPVTAVGRLFSATLVFGALVIGVMLGAVFGVWAGMPRLDPTATPPPPALPLWALAALAVVAVLAGGINQQVSTRHLGALAVVALLGYLTHWGGENLLDAGPRLAPAMAAVVMGLAARFIGLRIGAPALVLAVPAIVILLPGLAIFRSMYSMALDTGDLFTGLAGTFTALTIIMGIAAGVALGDTLARPMTKDWNARARRRIRDR